MIIAIGGIKGGTGKTTIAVNLVIERVRKGRKVLFLDSGLLEMGLLFSKTRKGLGIPTNWDFMLLNKNLSVSELKLLLKKYDDIIIDIRFEFNELCNILCLTDVLILPFKCSFFDTNSLKLLMGTINSLKLINKKMKVFILPTCVISGSKIEKKSTGIISEFMTCLPSLYDRIAYDRSFDMGLGILEAKKKDVKCCKEFNTFCQIVLYKKNFLQNFIDCFYENYDDLRKYFYCVTFLLILYFSNIEFGFSVFNFEFFSNYFNLHFLRKQKNNC